MKGTEVSAWLETQLNQLEIGVSIYTVARLKFKPEREMFLINLFLKLHVRKARSLCSTMGNQSIDWSHSKRNVCRLAQLHNVALG